jgi:hypothetical protein
MSKVTEQHYLVYSFAKEGHEEGYNSPRNCAVEMFKGDEAILKFFSPHPKLDRFVYSFPEMKRMSKADIKVS